MNKNIFFIFIIFKYFMKIKTEFSEFFDKLFQI